MTNKTYKTQNETSKIELTFEEAQKLDWFEEIVLGLEDIDVEEIKELEPSFKFFKRGEAEMYVGEEQANSSDGYTRIGAQGVEGENWEDFLEEVKEIRKTKTVKVKKSQLFKQFKRAMDQQLTGLEPLELQVWKHKDEVKEHYRSKGEFYPDGGPVAVLKWKSLTKDNSETRRFEWHHTKQDVVNSCLEHGPKDNEEELTERAINVNFEVTNQQLLEMLWNNRKQEIELRGDPREGEERDIKKIKLDWDDDTTAKKWTKEKFDFYNPKEDSRGGRE